MMKIKQFGEKILMAAGVTLLTGTTLLATSGCSNGYRSPPPVYKSVYYSPYDYYYYPSVSVYFHISSGYYFYRDGGTWIRVRTLPSRYYLDPIDRMRIVIKSDKPYLHNEQHRLKYKPHSTYRRDIKRNQIERNSNFNLHKTYQKNKSRRH